VVAVGLWAGGAHSQSQSQSQSSDGEGDLRRARQHFVNGKEAFEGKRYRAAFQEFQAGYEIDPRPGFLLDMGHAARRLGELDKARALYHQFLLVAPAGDGRRVAEHFLGEIDSQLGKTLNDGGVAAPVDETDSSSAGDTPIEPAPRTPPAVLVKPESLVPSSPSLVAVPQPGDAPAHDHDQERAIPLKWWVWAGIAALAAGTAAIFIVRAASSGDDAQTTGTWGQARL
jgi:tetratricopeptide (TPR) repeat protein